MVKKIGFVLALALVVAPAFASAATISNIKFDNGQTTTQCQAGQNVNAVVRVTVPVGEVVELSQADVIGDNLAPALPVSLGGENGLEEGAHDVNVVFPCPPNTGTYTVEVRTAGIFGGQRAVNITDGVVTVQTFGSALRVVAGGSTGGSVGGTSLEDRLAAFMAQVMALLHPVTPPAPSDPTCAAYAAAKAGAVMNVYSPANIKLQGFLLSQGASIPALAAGAAFGFYGPQTQAAEAGFHAAHPSCL